MATSFSGISGYSSVFNNPVNLSNPLEDCPTCPVNANEGDIWNYMGQLFRNIGGKWIGSGPETVITSARMPFSDFLGQIIVGDLGKFVNSAAIQMRANNELQQLHGRLSYRRFAVPLNGPVVSMDTRSSYDRAMGRQIAAKKNGYINGMKPNKDNGSVW